MHKSHVVARSISVPPTPDGMLVHGGFTRANRSSGPIYFVSIFFVCVFPFSDDHLKGHFHAIWQLYKKLQAAFTSIEFQNYSMGPSSRPLFVKRLFSAPQMNLNEK